jgi:hypothetical protein
MEEKHGVKSAVDVTIEAEARTGIQASEKTIPLPAILFASPDFQR